MNFLWSTAIVSIGEKLRKKFPAVHEQLQRWWEQIFFLPIESSQSF